MKSFEYESGMRAKDACNNADFDMCANLKTRDDAVFETNMCTTTLAHILYAGKSHCEIEKICEFLHTLIILAKTYCDK